MTSVTIQQFHEDIEAAERAADLGPVMITQDGQAKRVLIDVDLYRHFQELEQARETLSDVGPQPNVFAVPESEYFDWEPERFYFNFEPVEPA